MWDSPLTLMLLNKHVEGRSIDGMTPEDRKVVGMDHRIREVEERIVVRHGRATVSVSQLGYAEVVVTRTESEDLSLVQLHSLAVAILSDIGTDPDNAEAVRAAQRRH